MNFLDFSIVPLHHFLDLRCLSIDELSNYKKESNISDMLKYPLKYNFKQETLFISKSFSNKIKVEGLEINFLSVCKGRGLPNGNYGDYYIISDLSPLLIYNHYYVALNFGLRNIKTKFRLKFTIQEIQKITNFLINNKQTILIKKPYDQKRFVLNIWFKALVNILSINYKLSNDMYSYYNSGFRRRDLTDINRIYPKVKEPKSDYNYYGLNWRLDFGKYKGEFLIDVMEKDICYVKELISQNDDFVIDDAFFIMYPLITTMNFIFSNEVDLNICFKDLENLYLLNDYKSFMKYKIGLNELNQIKETSKASIRHSNSIGSSEWKSCGACGESPCACSNLTSGTDYC